MFFKIFIIALSIFSSNSKVETGQESGTDSGNTATTESFDIEEAVKRVMPSTKEETVKMIKTMLTTRASKYGWTTADYPMILAVAATESSFQHKMGRSGEVGMLQVIPTEKHVARIIAGIRCKATEKYCKPTGTPDVYRKDSSISGWLARKFIIEHPHYAFEAGFGELRFWQKKYENGLQRYLWKNYPGWDIKRRIKNYADTKDRYERYYYRVKKQMGDLAWVAHYNWGAQFIKRESAMHYPLTVLKWYNKLLKRKISTPYSRITVSVQVAQKGK